MEFLTNNWLFILLGLILVACIVVLIVLSVKSKKSATTTPAKKEEPKKAEVKKEEPKKVEAVKTTTKKAPAKKAEVKAATPETNDDSGVKKLPATVGAYTIEYNAEKRDWSVTKEGATRATKRLPTKQEAMDFAKNIKQ